MKIGLCNRYRSMVSVHVQSAHVCSGRLQRSQQIVSRPVRSAKLNGLLHRPRYYESHRGQSRGVCALAAASTSPATLPSELKKIVDLFNMVRGHRGCSAQAHHRHLQSGSCMSISCHTGARSQAQVPAVAGVRQEAASHAIRVPHRGEQSARLRVTGERPLSTWRVTHLACGATS